MEKKHLKRMACPKCSKTKLRSDYSNEGIRCDACKSEFPAGDAAVKAEWQRVQDELTPVPVSGTRY